jgi:hypothetical protein
MKSLLLLCLLFLVVSGIGLAQQADKANEEGRGAYKTRTLYNMEKYWDSDIVCKNPHKGWEFHFYDNGISNYGNRMKPGDYLKDFPGLANIYLRLGWSYLEPEEGKFNWQVIDTVINKWVAQGYKISFRITCKETGKQLFATPKWVMDAGAKGKFTSDPRSSGNWDPDYGDPIFLKKLENFHKAFAARYANKPWVEFIDLGSIGEWGEGHTAYSGRYDVPVNVIKKHIDLYRRCYPNNVLIMSDDELEERAADDGANDEILAYALKNHIGFRDDSSCVNLYVTRGYGYALIRSPEFFDKVWDNIPTVLECDHYNSAKRYNLWDGGKRFEKGMEETHATFISFHTWPREWLGENMEVAKKLANRCGYWYFPKYAVMPDTLRKNSTHNYLKMTWENHGVAPAYHHYDLRLQLTDKSSGKQTVFDLKESNNLNWKPDRIVGEEYKLKMPTSLAGGKYDIKIGMFDKSYGEEVPIQFAVKAERRSDDGYYKMGEIIVK